MEHNTNDDRPGTGMKPASVATLGTMLGFLFASAWIQWEDCPNGVFWFWFIHSLFAASVVISVVINHQMLKKTGLPAIMISTACILFFIIHHGKGGSPSLRALLLDIQLHIVVTFILAMALQSLKDQVLLLPAVQASCSIRNTVPAYSMEVPSRSETSNSASSQSQLSDSHPIDTTSAMVMGIGQGFGGTDHSGSLDGLPPKGDFLPQDAKRVLAFPPEYYESFSNGETLRPK